jgi:hypothetical protein
MNTLEIQVGGSHYKSLPYQPIELFIPWGTRYAEAAVVKYVSRYRAKNGSEDLEKAIHFVELLRDLRYRRPVDMLRRLWRWVGVAAAWPKRVRLSRECDRFCDVNGFSAIQRRAIRRIMLHTSEQDLDHCVSEIRRLIAAKKASVL